MNWKKLFGKPAEPAKLTPELRARIQASFDDSSRDEEHFPETIDPRIYHLKLIREHLGDLRGRRVLDVGCGKGRFARVFHEQEPQAELWGLDISPEMLRFVPAGIQTRAGSMTELPFEDAYFDGAYATESLEHAVEIERAVAEICRVVKPGGRIAVIDKNAEQWGKLETPEWERWFTRRELERMLGKHCSQVSSRFISYWEDVEPDGLFLAWLAVR
ncbi:MAG TPA: class I SAM-dependent methyltransferase [Bryobacteraceae bacterium]|nr:class I SAM-dependent methyltransferase [Bryobacteraceae bacterium]